MNVATQPAAVQRLVFAHSAWDALLVGLTFLHLTMIVFAGWFFAGLGAAALTAFAAFFVFMICTNYQCISHNHLHNPFFKSRALNAAFSAVNSIVLGMSQTLYRVHHMNHHVHNNDYLDPERGTTGDWSSLYRYSRHPRQPEGIVRYSLLGPLRVDYGLLWRRAAKKGLSGQLWLEHGAILLFYGGLLWLDWRYLLFYFLPVFYVGQGLCVCGKLPRTLWRHAGQSAHGFRVLLCTVLQLDLVQQWLPPGAPFPPPGALDADPFGKGADAARRRTPRGRGLASG